MNKNRLKFRAWDKLAKQFTYPDKGYQGHYVLDLNGKFHNLQNGSGGDEYVVQQFTGLKDSERNDIYEGDYVEYYKDEKNYLGTVSFFEGTFAVIGEHYHKNNELTVFKYRLYNLYTHIYDYKVKVVGNIFQLPCNPDHNGECLVCDESLDGCPFIKK